MAIFRGSHSFIMKLKKSCNCRGGVLTKETWKDFLFYELQQTNKSGKDRALVYHAGALTSLDVRVAEELELKKYGLIRVGMRSTTEIEIYEDSLPTL